MTAAAVQCAGVTTRSNVGFSSTPTCLYGLILVHAGALFICYLKSFNNLIVKRVHHSGSQMTFRCVILCLKIINIEYSDIIHRKAATWSWNHKMFWNKLMTLKIYKRESVFRIRVFKEPQASETVYPLPSSTPTIDCVLLLWNRRRCWKAEKCQVQRQAGWRHTAHTELVSDLVLMHMDWRRMTQVEHNECDFAYSLVSSGVNRRGSLLWCILFFLLYAA